MTDAHDVIEIERRLKEAAREMRTLAPEVATAITIIDYDSDRRKNLLARHAAKYIKEGDSAAAAETKARADKAYDEEYQGFFSQYEMAQMVRKKFEMAEISWDTGRSLLARQRVTLNKFPEE